MQAYNKNILSIISIIYFNYTNYYKVQLDLLVMGTSPVHLLCILLKVRTKIAMNFRFGNSDDMKLFGRLTIEAASQ